MKTIKILLVVCVITIFSICIMPTASYALKYNFYGWLSEQQGDFESDLKKRLESYKIAKDLYDYDNNTEAKKRVERKISKIRWSNPVKGFFDFLKD